MELSIEQQIFDTLGNAKKILIALPEVLTADSAASGLAMARFLRKTDKDVEIAGSGQLPDNLKFLPGSETIKSDVSGGSSLVITADTSSKKLDEISYQTVGDKVQIYLKAKDGMLTPEDLSFNTERFPVDAIIILEAKSLENLGKLFEQNPDLFFETPKINIDNHPDNEYFGAINLVDITASSVAEILSSLLEKYEASLLDEDIATCLLTGIITKTNSFQHTRTTPKAFLRASQLITLGGRQQEVVKNIYKTKSLPLLRLWGRALARLRRVENYPAMYSLLNAADFAKAGGAASDLLLVLKELADNVSGYQLMAILSELGTNEIKLMAAVHAQVDLAKFSGSLGGEVKILGNHLPAPFKVLELDFNGHSLQEAESKFLEAVKGLAISE